MPILRLCILAMAAALALPAVSADAPASPADEVRAAETAFANSMADRNFAAFSAHVSEEAIFYGEHGPLEGKSAVLAAWKGFFDGPKPPFSWKPEVVEVLASGTLAHSSGPVLNPEGKRVGTFNSVWRREADGRWRVVFDKGCAVCNCATGS